ncbi:helix-turn-helix domain-containing protein [Metabacillus endolithicus]|uniref:Helix-turn-helix domain-containing protein n=1 Tax=Metabacillus endolithicus TaxID=1535204 RepID=A0ABW5C5N0_9BACI|nr:helix-turn-helix transcriptional regulator [Metabacillus endolithicus]UPG66170.1 helix-turn-helix domain-containing protein [Metabacillus endolithicus]
MEFLSVYPNLIEILLPPHKGECVLLFRKQLGLTQSELAERVNLSRSAISKMESGTSGVNEKVWEYVTRNVFQSLHSNEKISYIEFREVLEKVFFYSQKKGVS